MNVASSRPALLNLDILALSLMCCLLAAVVGVLVLGGEEKPPTHTSTSVNSPSWTDLRQQTARLHVQVQEVELSREAIAIKLNHSVLERDNRTLESRIGEIEGKITLIRRLSGAKAESARLSAELNDKEKAANVTITPEAKRMLGEYKGPYVLVECNEDGALIYPGREKVEMKPSKDQADKLLNQITKAGFVAFVVRPGGWYGNSYDRLKALIYEELDKAEKQGGKYVGRSTFPLDAADPITNYLPPEH